MALNKEGSNIVIRDSVAGSVFPTSEADTVFPVMIDGSAKPVVIEGGLYGRSLEIRGDVEIRGPIVTRGDARLNPEKKQILLKSGITVNGSINSLNTLELGAGSLFDDIRNARTIIKGDISVNQNLLLRNTIVFGSVHAQNCALEGSIVLGTCVVEEKLRVAMSSIGGYAARDVTFEGDCLMLHAIGESTSQPLFVPFEQAGGEIIPSDVRYYPAIRDINTLLNRTSAGTLRYPDYSRLFPESDWVRADAHANPAIDHASDASVTRWILSIGGRIGDIRQIERAILSMSAMLKCGFEYEHYHPARRPGQLEAAMAGLTAEEQWVLQKVCA